MRRLAIILSLVIVVAAACGSEGFSREPLPTSPPSTPVILPSATPTVIPPLSDIEVKDAIISLQDLPSTWYNADSRAPARNDIDRCDVSNPFATNIPVADSTETFAASQTGPWIAETIYQMESTEHARALMADLEQSFSCGSWVQVAGPEPTPTADPKTTPTPPATGVPGATATEAEPLEVTWDIAQPSALDMRNGAFITRMISNTIEPVEYEIVFIRENNLIIQVSHWAREGVDTDITMSIVERSLENFDQTFAT